MSFLNLNIDAQTMKFALLGERLPHTWSPPIHNSLFAASGVNAVYLPMPMDRSALSSALGLIGNGFHGFNITIPYKELVIPYIDVMDDSAANCKSVNTIKLNDRGQLVGYSTDGEGFMRSLNERFIETEDINAVVLGSGGTARIAVYQLASRGSNVTIAARSKDKADELARELQPLVSGKISAIALGNIDSAYDLMVNTTPVGMYPHSDEAPVELAAVKRCGALFEAIYNPTETMLMRMGLSSGIKVVGGFKMLFYQAVEAQKIWGLKLASRKIQDEICKALERLI